MSTTKQADDSPHHARPAGETGVRLQAEDARCHPRRTQVVSQSSFASGRGVCLQAGQDTHVGAPDSDPDLVFQVSISTPGHHVLRTHAATDAEGSARMRQARRKHDSLPLMISVDGGRPTQRMVFVPWSQAESCRQTLGKFVFTEQEGEIRIWLPRGVRLDYLEILPYVPPAVPAAAAAYRPRLVPPASRPRIWMNAESLPRIRRNLTQGENRPFWSQVRELAAAEFRFHPAPDTEVGPDAALETAARAKAFVCLMEGEESLGREAVALIRDYLAVVEFGNLLDVTREIGHAIYTAAQVYDWCYALMSAADREAIRMQLMRLADDMEIGWPPFGQMIVNGHGAEAQINRDLLCLAIAVYDEDPLPYQYCAYRILEELAPMRRFEYQSPRHNQGISYGPSRFQWEMHAALLLYRMSGRRVFADSIMDVYRSWLYMRLPNDENLRDGDGFSDGRAANFGITPLLCYAYSGDALIKHDYLRQGGLRGDAVSILLLNDPGLEPAADFSVLPLSRYSGPGLGSMIARTSWNMGPGEADVVVEMKGGGYHFANHQHADAGSFQIYYRGLQVADLGQYHFYGTPYDRGFCKRSVAHSMMLAVDPQERFPGTAANDGGTRVILSSPRSAEEVRTDPAFANGTVLSADFGPSSRHPSYTYFSVDLATAYSDKIPRYVRSFCFLNLEDARTPAALIILDHMTTARSAIRKYWQLNTLAPPRITTGGVVLETSALGLAGRVDVRMLLPAADDRNVQILSDEEAHNVFGVRFTPPFAQRPEAHGHRVMFSPTVERTEDVFLTVLTMADPREPELPLHLEKSRAACVLSLSNHVVVLNDSGALFTESLDVDARDTGNPRTSSRDVGHGGDGGPGRVSAPSGLPPDGEIQLLVTGLAPGRWSIRDQHGKIHWHTRVLAGRNTARWTLPAGAYTIQPESTGA